MGLRRVSKKRSPYPTGLIGGVDFTIGALDANIRKVYLQLLDQGEINLTQQARFTWYVTTDPEALDVATALTGGVTDGGAGMCFQVTTGRYGWAVTDHDGQCDLNLTDSGNVAVYLALDFGDGELHVSPRISFSEAGTGTGTITG